MNPLRKVYFLLLSISSLTFAQDISQNAPQPEPIAYRNPITAMMERYNQPVSIEIQPGWNLTEKQKETALRAPQLVESNSRVCCVYPEDMNPTEEQLSDGSALNPLQRKLIRRARLRARQLAAWYARKDAEQYNKDNSDALAAVEKQGVHLVIHLRKQRGYCMNGTTRLRTFRVCSGKRSTPTPKGHYHVLEKRQKHRSNLYNASMPFFMRLTIDGVGLHQGPVRSYPASHGCIRLTYDDARFLFKTCDVGTAVFVVD